MNQKISNVTTINSTENTDQHVNQSLKNNNHNESNVSVDSGVLVNDLIVNYENKQSVNNIEIKLLPNQETYEDSELEKIEKFGKNERDGGYDVDGEQNDNDVSNLTIDYVRNTKKSKAEDIKVKKLLADESQKQTPRNGGAKQDEEVKIETPKMDPRFPNQNQTSHCWSAYVDFHRCVNLLGEGHDAAKYFKKVYTSMCPNRWVERWDEQRENGTFPAIIDRVKFKKDEEICDKTKPDYQECLERQKQAEKFAENETKQKAEGDMGNESNTPDKDKDKNSDGDAKKKKGVRT